MEHLDKFTGEMIEAKLLCNNNPLSYRESGNLDNAFEKFQIEYFLLNLNSSGAAIKKEEP